MRSTRKILLAAVAIISLLAAFGLVNRQGKPPGADNVMSLKSPPFLRVARAETGSTVSEIEDEAGISAYFEASRIIDLEDVRDIFRTIEVETADYIIGSVPVSGYAETQDVHVYVHMDGWALAYYLAADPVGKVFDWQDYDGSTITTKLEKTLIAVADAASLPLPDLTYYDFRHPSASHLMLIAEAQYAAGSDSFEVNLPGGFSYYERSWSHGSYGIDGMYGLCRTRYSLDGVEISYDTPDHYWYISHGFLTASQLSPDEFHTIEVWFNDSSYCDNTFGGLALVYEVP
jgi:hypothetical protein